MQKMPGIGRRWFCGAAAATVAASPPGLSSFLFSRRSTAMNAVAQPKGPEAPAIRPFHVDVSEAELTELRRRVKATVWPDRETVTDATQGVQLATVQRLGNEWATEYDWRKAAAKLKRLPQVITAVDHQ